MDFHMFMIDSKPAKDGSHPQHLRICHVHYFAIMSSPVSILELALRYEANSPRASYTGRSSHCSSLGRPSQLPRTKS